VLLRIPGLDETALPAELRRLAQVDPGGQLTRTVRAYLDHGGNGPAAAEVLHIHRTTLYYRLGRVRDLTGLDLDDGRTRLALHLGLALTDVIAAAGAEYL
jgi:DNA-binding PucR family transcriptional regulator